MSEWSKSLAEKFVQLKKDRVIENELVLKQHPILDEGLSALRADFIKALAEQCDEINEEPRIGNILAVSLSGDKPAVTRTDTGETLQIEFDKTFHTVSLKCDQPTKLRYYIEVKLTSETLYWYADRKGIAVGAKAGEIAARKGIQALLGVGD